MFIRFIKRYINLNLINYVIFAVWKKVTDKKKLQEYYKMTLL